MSLAEPTFHADLLILGGGCAGLSLATRLATRCPALKVIVVEPRTQYVEDRTWCGWRTLTRASNLYPYEMISAGRFYEHSCKTIQSSNSVHLSLGATVDSVTEDEKGVTATLGDTTSLRARWAVDTRPKIRPLPFPSLWQNFVGYEITVDQQCADQLGTTPVLMDFQPAGSSSLQFMYLLPLGDLRFLCEWTRFSPIHGELDQIEAELRGWLKSHACDEGRLGRRESGSLPMSVVPAPNSESRIIVAGTLGGSMRASTGYAFHSIQRWADRCTDALVAGSPPVSPLRSPTLNLLDDVFLTALQDRSTAAATVFTDLFAKTQPEILIRFLSSIPLSRDILPVMLSLPWIHFSKAALRTLLRRGATA
jgi:lycopene beta-cyclase